ncbi:UNVERIFIED_ORG: hypothetical protein ABIC54_004260 [Burkholderia sp. 1263]
MGQKFAAYDAQGAITGFYDSVDSPVPDAVTAVEITAELWQELINGQGQGRRLALDTDGMPALFDPLPPTRAQQADMMRARRDGALAATDWLVARHQDEKLIGDGTTLTAEQFTALLRYRQALRDLADATGWPNVELPDAPGAPDFVT